MLHRLNGCALQSQKMFQWLTLALYMPPMQHWKTVCHRWPPWRHLKMPAGRRATLRVQRQHPRALRAVAPHPHGCAQRHGRSRGRGCTAQQLAGCADGWCYEHRCHEGGACAARGRCVGNMAQAARVEPAPAPHVSAGSIDSESTLQRMLPKEFILIPQYYPG